MLLDLSVKQKEAYGVLFRYLWIQKKLTQKEVVEKSKIISLRTYLAIENGQIAKDDEIYDGLLNFYGFHHFYNFDSEQAFLKLYKAIIQFVIWIKK